MACEILTHKESKLNSLDNLKELGYLGETRKLDLSKKQEFDAYHKEEIRKVNDAYGLLLEKLYNIETTELDRQPYEKVYNERVVPIEEAFNAIDEARKELGIYEDKVSYGQHIRNQREIERQQMWEAEHGGLLNEDTEIEGENVRNHIKDMGEANKRNYPDGLFQQEGGITPFSDDDYDQSIDNEFPAEEPIDYNPTLSAGESFLTFAIT